MVKVMIDDVEYVPKDNSIEALHKKQLAFIKEHSLKVGDYITTTHKNKVYHLLKVTSLHPNYGWICGEDQKGFTAYDIPVENIVSVYNKWGR